MVVSPSYAVNVNEAESKDEDTLDLLILLLPPQAPISLNFPLFRIFSMSCLTLPWFLRESPVSKEFDDLHAKVIG